jgi:hypothetical protein
VLPVISLLIVTWVDAHPFERYSLALGRIVSNAEWLAELMRRIIGTAMPYEAAVALADRYLALERRCLSWWFRRHARADSAQPDSAN